MCEFIIFFLFGGEGGYIVIQFTKNLNKPRPSPFSSQHPFTQTHTQYYSIYIRCQTGLNQTG